MEQAKLFLTHFNGFEGYVVFFLILTGCGCGMPFNSDFMIITASVLAGLHYFQLKFLLPTALLGLIAGDSINFWVARRYGKTILRNRPLSWILTPEKVTAAEKYMAEKGKGFLFCVRFLPLIRTVLYFTAGSLQTCAKKFYLLNIASTTLYLLVLMNTAYYAGENIDEVVAWFKQFQFALLGLLVALIAVIVLRKKLKGRVAS